MFLTSRPVASTGGWQSSSKPIAKKPCAPIALWCSHLVAGCTNDDWQRINPFDGFERPTKPIKGRSTWIKKEEVQKLIDSASSDDLRFILYCGFHGGLRRSEISWAKVDWFDLENNLIHVTNDPETGALLKDENRVVPITKPFAEFLMKYIGDRSSTEYVLAPKKEKGLAKYRYDFVKQFKSHVKSCTIHDMRRSFASNLASAGVSIYKIAQWLGDRVDVVERSYGHLAPADQDVNRLV